MSRSPLWQRCNIPVPIITRAQCHHLPYPHTGVPDVLLFRTQCSSSFYVGHSDCVWDSGTSGCPDCNQCCYFVDFFPVQTQCLNIWKNYVMLLLSPKTLSGRSLHCSHQSGASIHLLACTGITAATFWLVDGLPPALLLFTWSSGTERKQPYWRG